MTTPHTEFSNPNVRLLARPDVLSFQPYIHAEWQPHLERMHANENPWRAAGEDSQAGLNRYPESPADTLHQRLAELYGVSKREVIAGRGSDEGIDLLVRAFCRAGADNIVICSPTFGFYKVAAALQGAGVVDIPLIRKPSGFELNASGVLQAITPATKLVFLCSPGNPTGNALSDDVLLSLAGALNEQALLVIDEAYNEFTGRPSLATHLHSHPNLVILRTLSKAYALAGVRCGTVIAHHDIIALLSRVLPPYAIPTNTIETVLAVTAEEHRATIHTRIVNLIEQREWLTRALADCPAIRHVYPSDANFLLVECHDGAQVLNAAQAAGLIVRDFRKAPQCSECVRVTVGTPDQNRRLLDCIAALPVKEVS